MDEGYLKKYHDEHMKVSIVSVSLLAKLPHFGHVVLIQLLLLPRELILLEDILISFGNLTGISFLFTGTEPQLVHLIIGIGHPQYLCLEINQSLKRNWILFSAHPFRSPCSEICFLASLLFKPSKLFELIKKPLSVKALVNSLVLLSLSLIITCLISIELILANSKSLSSCAGTPITAPVPYSSRT